MSALSEACPARGSQQRTYLYVATELRCLLNKDVVFMCFILMMFIIALNSLNENYSLVIKGSYSWKIPTVSMEVYSWENHRENLEIRRLEDFRMLSV